jgi:molybdopterin/thiamine biosynthesis adenylyltransferase
MSLKGKKIGIIGMSFGSAIAFALATERNFGEIRLADFDQIDLINLNRMPFSINQIGQSKTIATARKIAEIDPYLIVKIFPKGIEPKSLEKFIDVRNPLDLIIEECDAVEVKFLTRQIARRYGIPVIMETNAKPMLDIERFDLEPTRPIFHGWIANAQQYTWSGLQKMTKANKKHLLMQFVREEGLTEILKLSVDEIGKSLVSFCQPASSFILGSGIICEITRLILLKKHKLSGRYVFDIDQWLGGSPTAA